MSYGRNYPGRQWKDRLDMWAEEFPKHYILPEEELKVSGFVTKERLTYNEALERAEREAKPVPEGTAWGCYWEYGWFFLEYTVPERLAGKRLVFLPGFGEEMLVWVNGRESGAVDKKHSCITLSKNAEAGERFLIAAECYAGHCQVHTNLGALPFEVCSQVCFDVLSYVCCNTYYMLCCPGHLAALLNKFCCRCMANRTFCRCCFSFINISTYAAYKFFHCNSLLFFLLFN